MIHPIIEIENLSKRYYLGGDPIPGEGLRHKLDRSIHRILNIKGHVKKPSQRETKEFWALSNVNFSMATGEIVGIIGRNGAGKSTLLKVLSRITEPTFGVIRLNGRVSSLLEVGTGFHPELTGRENIFLNGAILGMKRSEIRRKFKEITDFAEIGRFLDTPVKRYSSGMYVRLAFAVAAHLEPDILIVDEVMAVGDSDFQQKCLGKIEDVSSREGRTVILVSHQLPAIQHLCDRCILLDQGTVVGDGPTDSIIQKYLAMSARLASDPPSLRLDRSGKGDIQVTSVKTMCDRIQDSRNIATGHNLLIRIAYRVQTGSKLKNCIFCLEIHTEFNILIALSSQLVNSRTLNILSDGIMEFSIPSLPLSGGTYQINTYIESEGVMQDYLDSAGSFDVTDGDFYGTGKLNHEGWQGKTVLVRHSWINYPNSSDLN
jgi:lipopolysaccharide transport system ATP-binding protein